MFEVPCIEGDDMLGMDGDRSDRDDFYLDFSFGESNHSINTFYDDENDEFQAHIHFNETHFFSFKFK